MVDHFLDQLVHVGIAGGVDPFGIQGHAIEVGALMAVEIGAAAAILGLAQIEDAGIECGIDMDAAAAAIAPEREAAMAVEGAGGSLYGGADRFGDIVVEARDGQRAFGGDAGVIAALGGGIIAQSERLAAELVGVGDEIVDHEEGGGHGGLG